MVKVAALSRVSQEVQNAFLAVWIESKMLPRSVGDRPVLARALRVLFPGYSGPPLMLYRGTRASERRRRLYGFSWTTEAVVARKFAEQWETPLPGGAPRRRDPADLGAARGNLADPKAGRLL
jgi:hypothetical protein